MTEELSFELLAQHYGLGSNDLVGAAPPGDGQLPDEGYPPFSPDQPLPHAVDVAAIAQHFDFARAEATGLVAPSIPQPIPLTVPASSSADPSVLRNRMNCSESSIAGRNQRLGSGFKAPQAPDAIYAEPEPGRKVFLKPITDLPALYRPLFSFPFFNAVQSICFPKVYDAADNVVLSAPTGSGKTVVFELALLRMLTKEPENARAVYLAPTKALCSERTRDWSARFGSVGCGVTELTGDSVHGLHVARKSRLIVTTPEKWDSLTRKWLEQSPILSTVKLVLIDEVHILNEPHRGARLEVVVTRIKNRGHQVRFIAVSATVPNLEDVASWIGSNASTQPRNEASQPDLPAVMFQFGEAYRPCPLQKHVYGYPKARDEFAFQSYLNHKLLELIETHAAGRPCLVFCATRRSTVQAASTIAEAFKKAGENGSRPTNLGPFDDQDLQSLAPARVAFHHAGLSPGDRRKIEQAFLAEQISVLCCTTTLATGINLPAYCVIIRGTKQYEGQWCEMSELDLIQMMGRAGRPQFDRSGVAVIMCEDAVQSHYRELVSGSRDIESSLATSLVEHVNAEVGLCGRTSEAQIEAWIRQSFMWIRLQKNPTYYLSQEEGIGLDSVQEILQHLCRRTLAALQSASLVSCSEDRTEIKPTEYGEIMSRFFLRHRTMLALIAIPEGATTRDILGSVAAAEEFGDQRIRHGEKGFLQGLRTHAEIRFPPRQVASVADKVSLLIQATLAAISLTHLAKTAPGEANPFMDAKRIFQHATRIVKAAVDITIYRRDGPACKAALDLARSIAARAWDGSPAMLRQVDQIGDRSVKALANAGVTTWQHLASSSPARIELILNRNPPFGNKVVAAAQSVPRIGLEVMQKSYVQITSEYASTLASSTSCPVGTSGPGTKVVLDVTVRIENRATCMLKSKNTKMALSVCILTLTSDNDYVDFRRMPIWRFDREKRFTLHVHLRHLRLRVLTYAACDEIAGTMMQASLMPADMANGSHRTRIARAELQSDGSGFFDVENELNVPPPTLLSTDLDSGYEMDEEAASESTTLGKRCKHKCKDSCRHVCCIRAREEEASGGPRECRFQSRVFDWGPTSRTQGSATSNSTPAGSSGLSGIKRKASVVRDDDLDGPQDLLSQLDRLSAGTNTDPHKLLPLRMPNASRGRLIPPRPSEVLPGSQHGLARAADSGRRLVSPTGYVSNFEPNAPPEHLPDALAERPAQRRFLRALNPPSWLDS